MEMPIKGECIHRMGNDDGRGRVLNPGGHKKAAVVVGG